MYVCMYIFIYIYIYSACAQNEYIYIHSPRHKTFCVWPNWGEKKTPKKKKAKITLRNSNRTSITNGIG